jgi:VWFA-related protein
MRTLLLAVLLACCTALSQGPGVPTAAPGEVVFRVTTTQVQIDAEVTDSKGNHVNNLKADDFEVFLDKKLQPVTSLSYVSLEPPDINQAAMASPGAHDSGHVIKPANVRRATVILVDDLTMSFESMAMVRRMLRQLVETQTEPGDLVAIWQAGNINGVYQQLTSDKRVLEAAIGSIHWNVRSGRSGGPRR